MRLQPLPVLVKCGTLVIRAMFFFFVQDYHRAGEARGAGRGLSGATGEFGYILGERLGSEL